MGSSSRIGKHYLNRRRGKWIYALKSPSGKTFLDDCMRKDPDRAARFASTAERVFDRGCTWAFDSGTIKRIKTGSISIDVFETVVKGGVIRVATYVYLGYIPIYLFDFKTHPGSGNNLPDHDIKRAIQSAEVAAKEAQCYDFSAYEGRPR